MGHEKLFTAVGMLGIYAGGKALREDTMDESLALATAGVGFFLFLLGIWGFIQKSRF